MRPATCTCNDSVVTCSAGARDRGFARDPPRYGGGFWRRGLGGDTLTTSLNWTRFAGDRGSRGQVGVPFLMSFSARKWLTMHHRPARNAPSAPFPKNYLSLNPRGGFLGKRCIWCTRCILVPDRYEFHSVSQLPQPPRGRHRVPGVGTVTGYRGCLRRDQVAAPDSPSPAMAGNAFGIDRWLWDR